MKTIGLLLVAVVLPSAMRAATINVSTSSQLASAAASANPGDTIVLANGNYSGFTMHRSGNSSSAITFQAANVGGAVINSGTIVLTNLSYVNLDGINFTTSGGSTTVDGTARAFAVLIVNANFCRVTRCSFALSGEAAGTGWVTLDANSQHNRVDHCAFGPNNVGSHSHYIYPAGSHSIPGVTPPSDRTSWAYGNGPYNTDMPRFTEIDHNYFHDMPSTDGETIVLGGAGVTGDYQGTMSTVESNLFVNCNGDPEVISVKSSTNTLRYNTVKTSAGVFSLRSGNNSFVYGNFFLCAGTGGGVKINEMHHKVYNNYIENTDTSNYPIMAENGDPYSSGTFAHGQVVDAEIVYNTIVNPGRQVLIGHGSSTLAVSNSYFANNIISGSGTLYSESGTTPINMTRSQNIANGTAPSQSGFISEDPAFTTVTENSYGLQKLSSTSPAIGAANTSYFSYVTTDMDGQTRSSPDIGADEYSTGSILIAPVTTSDVGPASGGGIINAADFTISASPSSQTVTAGGSTSYTATIGALNGFSSSVSLTVSGLPANTTASFNPSSVSGSGASTLTVNTTSSTPTGTSTLTITGTSGSLTHSTTVSLTVSAAPDFSLSASPGSVTITQGNNGTSTITVNPLNGYTGTVSLSASGLPSGVTASFNPASTTTSSTLTLTASSTATVGAATVTVTGTDGTLTHTTTISLTVNASSGGSLPSGWTDADIGAVGLSGSASYNSGTFTLNGSGNDIWSTSDAFNFAYQSLSGDGTIIAHVASQQNTSGWAKSGIMFRDSTAANAAYAGLYLTPSNGVSMQLRPSNGASAIDVGRQTGLTVPYWVKLVRSGNTFTGYSSPDGSTWTQVGATNATIASAAIVGLADCAHNNSAINTSTYDNVSMTGPAPDFSLSDSPSSLTITEGANGTSTVTVNPINGYNNTVSLSASGLPSGVMASFNPSSTTASSTLTLTASSTATIGTATVTITGTDGTLTHTTTVSLTVSGQPDFSLSASPSSLTVTQGANGTSAVTVNPLNGYNNTVSLSASGLPSGVTASFNPASTTTSSTLTLTASSTATTGTATVTVTGADGTLTHNTSISLTVNPASTNNFAGIFKIQNEASGLVLNNRGSLTNGSAITQWTATTTSTNLDWTFIATSNGYYQINSARSGLDAVVQGASTANGAGIVQWSFGSSGDDQWLPQQNSDGSYTFFNLHSGLVLEDPGSSTNKTTQMDQWSSNGGSNQKWILLKQ